MLRLPNARNAHYLLGGLSAVAALLFAAVVVTDAELKAAGYGIVRLQLAATAGTAQTILDAWRGAGALDGAWLNTQIDFAFLLAYPPAFALACRELARRRHSRFGVRLSIAVLACTPLDALENLALMHMLAHGASDVAAGLATACAVPKFALVGIAIAYCVSALLRRPSWRRT
jgi:hypothetical protein